MDKQKFDGLIFYRCAVCNGVVSPWDIAEGGCQDCGCKKLRPTNLTLKETVQQIWKHPKLWEWKHQKAGQSGEVRALIEQGRR